MALPIEPTPKLDGAESERLLRDLQAVCTPKEAKARVDWARRERGALLNIPAQRAAEKQASRDDDAEALRSGTKTVGQLRREDSFTAVVKFAPTDYTKVPRARIRRR